MAEEKFKVDDGGIDTSEVASSLKESAPKVSSSTGFETGFETTVGGGNTGSKLSQTMDSIDSKSYNSERNRSSHSTNQSNNQTMNRNSSANNSKSSGLQKGEEKPTPTPVEQSQVPTSGGGQREAERTGNGFNSQSLPKDKGLPGEEKASPSLGENDGLNGALPNSSNMPPSNNHHQGLDDGSGQEKSPEEKKKEEKQRADDNNANNIKNAAAAAKASGNPYAMAAGTAIDAADKITNGELTRRAGELATKINKMVPGGRRIQNMSNGLSESGASDKIGQAASAKSGGANKAAKGADTAKKGGSTKKPDPKRARSNKSAGAADGDPNRTENAGANLDGIAKAIGGFLLRHPFILIVVALIILLFLIFLTSDEFTGSDGANRFCSYSLNGVTNTGNVELNNVQVELINCDGTASNYTVLETIDFEKYVLGVALAEIGPSSPDEGIKAQIIAARNFALTRNKGMCPSNPDNCFYGYNVETKKIRMRACEADQVYWDYEKDIYRQDRGAISLYSPEINSGTVWKHALSAERKAQVEALANEVKGKVLLDENGNVMPTSYKSTDQASMLEDAKAGKNYQEILEHKYGSSSFNSATCSNYGMIDYGNYQLNSDGDTILNERLDKFLESKGTSLEQFNKLIESNVQKNGYGTRAGVVAAAVTLIAELGNNYNVKVPYFLSGGHHDGVRQGALGYWGSGVEDNGHRCYYTGYGNIYTVCGLDCSGFVPWAIKNGGFQVSVNLAGNFQNLDGARRVSLNSGSAVLEPGDLLESEGHIVLVVGIDESNKKYICAEAAGKSQGVLFTRRAFGGGGGYWGVKMDGYYDKYSLKGK